MCFFVLLPDDWDTGTSGHLDTGTKGYRDSGTMGGVQVRVPTYRNRVVIFLMVETGLHGGTRVQWGVVPHPPIIDNPGLCVCVFAFMCLCFYII